MKTKCPLPKGFSGTRRVFGVLVGLLALALLFAPGAGAAPFAYISNLNSGTVTVIDGTTVLTPPGGLAAGAQPMGVAVNPAGTRAYVVNTNLFATGVPSLSVIDTASLSVVATVPLPGQPAGVAVSDDGSLVYVANGDGTVSVIDGTIGNATSNTIVNTLSPLLGQSRQLSAIVVVGGSVYATDLFAGEVVNVTNTAMPRLFVSFDIMGIAASPSGSTLYVSYGDAFDGNLKIAIIDVATSFTQQRFTPVLISTDGMDSGFDPAGIAVHPSGTFVYATVLNENAVAVMNTANNSVVLRPVGRAPFGVAVDPLGTRVYVTNSRDNNVTVLDASTNMILAGSVPVPVGFNPMVFGSFVASVRAIPPPSQFMLTLNPAGSGAIAAQPSSVTGKYDAGTTVTLTAQPDAGFAFTGWSDDCSGSNTTCVVTMDRNRTVGATFTAQYSLFVTTLGSGTVAAAPQATAVVLTATADPGFVFTGWSGACSGSNATCNLTMDATKSVTATFTAEYSLFVTTL